MSLSEFHTTEGEGDGAGWLPDPIGFIRLRMAARTSMRACGFGVPVEGVYRVYARSNNCALAKMPVRTHLWRIFRHPTIAR
jgi:hypothetical protein